MFSVTAVDFYQLKEQRIEMSRFLSGRVNILKPDNRLNLLQEVVCKVFRSQFRLRFPYYRPNMNRVPLNRTVEQELSQDKSNRD